MSKRVMETAFESRATTDGSGKLSRPWAVLVTGCLVSIGMSVLLLAKGGLEAGLGAAGACLAGVVLTAVYVVIGRRYGKMQASRYTGAIGILLALAGVAYLAFEVFKTDY